MENIIEVLKAKQRERIKDKKAETQNLRSKISFSFAGITTGYKTTDWRLK